MLIGSYSYPAAAFLCVTLNTAVFRHMAGRKHGAAISVIRSAAKDAAKAFAQRHGYTLRFEVDASPERSIGLSIKAEIDDEDETSFPLSRLEDEARRAIEDAMNSAAKEAGYRW